MNIDMDMSSSVGLDDFDEDGLGNLQVEDREAPAVVLSTRITHAIDPSTTTSTTTNTTVLTTIESSKTAKCKRCGLLISRNMEDIESHMSQCTVGLSTTTNTTTTTSGSGRSNTTDHRNNSTLSIYNDKSTYMLDGSNMIISSGTSKTFGGIVRRPELEKCPTRVIYRTARRAGKNLVRPREVCAFQDSFIDEDGACYVYEISIRHCDVMGIHDYITADVMILMHVAYPIKGSKSMSNITIISQVNTHSKVGWLSSMLNADLGGASLGRLHKDDLVRELKSAGNLVNILKQEQQDASNEEDDANAASLEDFELLCVLGRGGFGKVMQVRHRNTEVSDCEI